MREAASAQSLKVGARLALSQCDLRLGFDVAMVQGRMRPRTVEQNDVSGSRGVGLQNDATIGTGVGMPLASEFRHTKAGSRQKLLGGFVCRFHFATGAAGRVVMLRDMSLLT
jgi:hypothetical protein